MNNIKENLINKCIKAKKAGKLLAVSTGAERNNALLKMADFLICSKAEIIEENKKDLANAKANGIKDAMLDRLMLNESRIETIANAIRKIADLADPIGTGEIFTRPNGLEIHKTSVPLGVVAMIYEARPNVTPDAASLCMR